MLVALRVAVRRLVEGSPVAIQRAADLRRALGVDAPLGWQIFRLSMATDPFATVLYIPRTGSMTKVLRQARERGFAPELVDTVAAAYADFESFVAKSAGTRGNFDAMIAALGRDASAQIDIKQRGAAFRANTHVWGIQTRTDYRGVIWTRGSGPLLEHIASFGGRVHMQQLRPSAVMRVRRGVIMDSNSSVPSRGLAKTSPRTQLLEDYCSDPCPKFELTREPAGVREFVRPFGVGAAGAITFFGYQVAMDWNKASATEPQTWWGVRAFCALPTEVLLLDLLVPRGWSDPSTVNISTHGNLAEPQSVEDTPGAYLMPATESVQYLGSDLEALHTTDVPRCPEMLRTVLTRLGWLNTEFDVFRARIRYPILHSLVTASVLRPGAVRQPEDDGE